jgi:hypothetical protein
MIHLKPYKCMEWIVNVLVIEYKVNWELRPSQQSDDTNITDVVAMLSSTINLSF